VSAAVRVVVVDDHPLIRQGLRAVLTSLEGFEMVGEASTGDEAFAVVRACRPDVVLMDLNLPGTDGLAVTKQIVAECPEVGVLVLTMREDDAAVFTAMRAGARGYLVKGADQEEIVRAITSVARGEAIFGSHIATRVLDALSSPPSKPRSFPQLTPREHEVLVLLAAGKSNIAISRELGLNTRTVANHMSSIFTKLPAEDRADAIILARNAGLGT
jgi:DNA-binding NarL/FixJ family response regulator